MKKIVIIEDDLLLAEMIKTSINGLEGYQCNAIFTNVKEFLYQPEQWEIVLLDIVLPEISGLEAIKMILEKCPNTSIVMNSIKDDPDSIFKAIQLGAVGYIDKQSFEMNFKEVFDCLENGGAYMTPKIARKVISYFQIPKMVKIECLDNMETEIVHGILEGLTYKQIADKNIITIDSVRTKIKRIYRKLEINSKGELLNLFK